MLGLAQQHFIAQYAGDALFTIEGEYNAVRNVVRLLYIGLA